MREILYQFISDIEREVIDNMDAGDVNATGETKRSFEKEVSLSRGILYAAKHIGALEYGRGPTKSGGGQGITLRQIIRKWIDDKGIVPEGTSKDSLAYLISRKIHNEGTKLYREGGFSGILTRVITPERVDALAGAIGDAYFQRISNVVKSL